MRFRRSSGGAPCDRLVLGESEGDHATLRLRGGMFKAACMENGPTKRRRL